MFDGVRQPAWRRACLPTPRAPPRALPCAEEIEPLAVPLGLPGSTKAAEADQPYSYRDNPWRGEDVAPMAANVRWDLFAGAPSHGEGGTRYLLRMLHNEKETAFKPSCEPIAKGSCSYDLRELQRCYDRG